MANTPVVGAWQLVSHVLVDEVGRPVARPLGPEPCGTLLYTADGHMSVHMMSHDRPSFATRSAAVGDDRQKIRAAETYVGYCGRYEWLDDRVVHRVTVSFFPDYVGAEMTRAAELDGDVLTLRAFPPSVRRARPTPVLVWRRMVGHPHPPAERGTMR